MYTFCLNIIKDYLHSTPAFKLLPHSNPFLCTKLQTRQTVARIFHTGNQYQRQQQMPRLRYCRKRPSHPSCIGDKCLHLDASMRPTRHSYRNRITQPLARNYQCCRFCCGNSGQEITRACSYLHFVFYICLTECLTVFCFETVPIHDIGGFSIL